MSVRIQIAALAIIGLIACTKQAPQLPANKLVPDNSKAEALLAINENLTLREDSLLERFVSKSGKDFIKNELGYWYRVDQAGSGSKIEKESVCSFSYKLTLINGQIADTGHAKIKTGKKEIVTGLDECIMHLHRGDNATVIIPWYLAFGMKGSETPRVPPYTSVIYQISINP